MLTNDLLDGVVAALAAEFPGIPVFDERVEQGIVEPSFTVRCVRPKQDLFRDVRYARDDLIEVVYFPPAAGEARHDINEVMDALYLALELITADGDPVRGSQMQAHVDEENRAGVFTVNYRYFARTDDSGRPVMETLIEGDVIVNG